HLQAFAGGGEGDRDDGEVEHVPAAAEEAQAVDEQLERKLDHEHGECAAVEREQQAAGLVHGGGGGFEAERDRVDDDHDDDEALEGGGFDEALESRGHLRFSERTREVAAGQVPRPQSCIRWHVLPCARCATGLPPPRSRGWCRPPRATPAPESSPTPRSASWCR